MPTEDGFVSTCPGDGLPSSLRGEEAVRGLNWRADKVIRDAEGKIHIYGEIVP